MAAIDKIYLNYEGYKEFYDWAKDKDVEYGDHTTKPLLNFFYACEELPRECFFGDDGKEKCVPVMTPPYAVDYWLARNCPVQAVLDELKTNYGEEDFEDMRKGDSFIDSALDDFYASQHRLFPVHYSLWLDRGPRTRSNYKFFKPSPYTHKRRGFWFVDIEDGERRPVFYNRNTGLWAKMSAPLEWTDSRIRIDNVSLRSVVRRMSRANLLRGYRVIIEDRVCGARYIMAIK